MCSMPNILAGVAVALFVLLVRDCHSYQTSSYRSRVGRPRTSDDALGKLPADIFGSLEEEPSRMRDETEASNASDEAPLLYVPLASKRRSGGPTLSVVNPLEILRHRLMLDMARRRMMENERQTKQNAELLEVIGKRSIKDQEETAYRN